jgi:hypothetical protein
MDFPCKYTNQQPIRAVLILCVRYCYQNKIEGDLLCCKSLESHTTGEAIDTYMIQHNISWQNYVNVCTDGARAMLRETADVVILIKALALSCSSSHCVVHRQAQVIKQRKQTRQIYWMTA